MPSQDCVLRYEGRKTSRSTVICESRTADSSWASVGFGCFCCLVCCLVCRLVCCLVLPVMVEPAYDAAFMASKSIGRQSSVREKGQLMSSSEIERTLVRLAHEIIEKNNGISDLGLVGVRRRGVPLAQRLAGIVQRIEKGPVPVGTLDITLYRDDLSTLGPKPVVQKTEMGFPIVGKNIILVDDVLYTGRTARAALDALFQ